MNNPLVPIQKVIREFFAEKPKEVNGIFNSSCDYYQKWMLNKIFGRFEFSGFLDYWDNDYFLTTLFLDGKLCITNTSEFGVLPLRCGLKGINVFSHPTDCVIANPKLNTFSRRIGDECALVKIYYDYTGISRQLARYSYLLASCDAGISVNLMNCKVTLIGSVESEKEAKEAKKMFDDISMGKPAVYVNNKIADKFTFLPAKQNYIADQIQDTKRTIINEFLTEWGINNANTDKKERLVKSEVDSNNEEINVNVQTILDNITEGFKVANRLFGLNLSVKLKKWGVENGRTILDTGISE